MKRTLSLLFDVREDMADARSIVIWRGEGQALRSAFRPSRRLSRIVNAAVIFPRLHCGKIKDKGNWKFLYHDHAVDNRQYSQPAT